LTQALSSYTGVSQVTKLISSDFAEGDNFGKSVAIDGDIMFIGAPYDDDKGSKSGSVYVFTRDIAGSPTANWTQRAKLLASDGTTDDYFGVSVALCGDTVVVGASGNNGYSRRIGAAYVFTRVMAGSQTVNFVQRAKLLSSDGIDAYFFGYSVGISGDTIVVGAFGGLGSAYVFTRDVAGSLTSSWVQRTNLLASDGASGDLFGHGVAISGDTIVGGAFRHDDRHGSAYIFTRDVAGSLTSSWTQRAKLLASDGVADDGFGRSVAISGDTVVIGATGEYAKASKIGSAYIFTRNVPGSLTASWAQQTKLLASDGAAFDHFGLSVAIDSDTIVVGAYGDDDEVSAHGSAYIFTRTIAGGLMASWTERAKLRASDGQTSGYFGRSLAICSDTVAVGAYDYGSIGSTYVFAMLPPPRPSPPPTPPPLPPSPSVRAPLPSCMYVLLLSHQRAGAKPKRVY